MVTALDRAIPPVALRLIRQFGKRITLLYPGGDPVYDPDTGGTVGGDPVPVEVRAIIEGYADHLAADDGAGIQRGDRKVTIAAQGLPGEPDTAVRAIIEGHEHTVVKADAVYSGERPAIYTLQVRR